ncbi:MAG: hypothetical protein R2839_01180 [Thermomicrobiales bacterium]
MTVTTQKPADSPSSPGNSEHPEPASREFDPTPYLRQIRGRGGQTSEYLDVRHRVLWLRTVHPDAQILTELLQIDDGSAVFRASVTIPGGGSATGHGSESRSDFVDFVEKAETKALGRALNALGFGVQFAETEGEERETPSSDRWNGSEIAVRRAKRRTELPVRTGRSSGSGRAGSDSPAKTRSSGLLAKPWTV